MSDGYSPRISKAAFFLGDVLLLGLAGYIVFQSQKPLDPWHTLLLFLAVVSGAWLAVYPFIAEYKAAVRLHEASALDKAIERLQGMETIGNQILALSSQWQTVQDHATATVKTVHEISDRMSAEAKAFADLTIKMNQQEKTHLRLEAEKLRRSEGEWIQVLMGCFDHVFALFQAALRSREERVIEQVGKLQGACHDIARRVGFVPFGASPDDPFDPNKHQTQSGKEVAPGTKIVALLAPGYMYQGQLVRRVLVALPGDALPPQLDPKPASSAEPQPQAQLPI